jgi:hypothetical protein
MPEPYQEAPAIADRLRTDGEKFAVIGVGSATRLVRRRHNVIL